MTDVEVTVRIAASPERVWELVGDLSRMGEWSPECRRVEWVGGSTGPALDARFRGHNQFGWRRWTTNGRIVTYEKNSAVAFDVSVLGMPVARWSYELQPDGDGTALTERFVDHRQGLLKALAPLARGVSDTETHNRAGMQQTLERIRAAAEA